jgi:hypothetical protein
LRILSLGACPGKRWDTLPDLAPMRTACCENCGVLIRDRDLKIFGTGKFGVSASYDANKPLEL